QVTLALEGLRNNSSGLDELTLQDVISELLTDALRNVVLTLHFTKIPNFPPFIRARQAPDRIVPIGYDAMVREVQSHPAPKVTPRTKKRLMHGDAANAAALGFNNNLSEQAELTLSEEELIYNLRNGTVEPEIDQFHGIGLPETGLLTAPAPVKHVTHSVYTEVGITDLVMSGPPSSTVKHESKPVYTELSFVDMEPPVIQEPHVEVEDDHRTFSKGRGSELIEEILHDDITEVEIEQDLLENISMRRDASPIRPILKVKNPKVESKLEPKIELPPESEEEEEMPLQIKLLETVSDQYSRNYAGMLDDDCRVKPVVMLPCFKPGDTLCVMATELSEDCLNPVNSCSQSCDDQVFLLPQISPNNNSNPITNPSISNPSLMCETKPLLDFANDDMQVSLNHDLQLISSPAACEITQKNHNKEEQYLFPFSNSKFDFSFHEKEDTLSASCFDPEHPLTKNNHNIVTYFGLINEEKNLENLEKENLIDLSHSYIHNDESWMNILEINGENIKMEENCDENKILSENKDYENKINMKDCDDERRRKKEKLEVTLSKSKFIEKKDIKQEARFSNIVGMWEEEKNSEVDEVNGIEECYWNSDKSVWEVFTSEHVHKNTHIHINTKDQNINGNEREKMKDVEVRKRKIEDNALIEKHIDTKCMKSDTVKEVEKERSVIDKEKKSENVFGDIEHPNSENNVKHKRHTVDSKRNIENEKNCEDNGNNISILSERLDILKETVYHRCIDDENVNTHTQGKDKQSYKQNGNSFIQDIEEHMQSETFSMFKHKIDNTSTYFQETICEKTEKRVCDEVERGNREIEHIVSYEYVESEDNNSQGMQKSPSKNESNESENSQSFIGPNYNYGSEQIFLSENDEGGIGQFVQTGICESKNVSIGCDQIVCDESFRSESGNREILSELSIYTALQRESVESLLHDESKGENSLGRESLEESFIFDKNFKEESFHGTKFHAEIIKSESSKESDSGKELLEISLPSKNFEECFSIEGHWPYSPLQDESDVESSFNSSFDKESVDESSSEGSFMLGNEARDNLEEFLAKEDKISKMTIPLESFHGERLSISSSDSSLTSEKDKNFDFDEISMKKEKINMEKSENICNDTLLQDLDKNSIKMISEGEKIIKQKGNRFLSNEKNKQNVEISVTVIEDDNSENNEPLKEQNNGNIFEVNKQVCPEISQRLTTDSYTYQSFLSGTAHNHNHMCGTVTVLNYISESEVDLESKLKCNPELEITKIEEGILKRKFLSGMLDIGASGVEASVVESDTGISVSMLEKSTSILNTSISDQKTQKYGEEKKLERILDVIDSEQESMNDYITNSNEYLNKVDVGNIKNLKYKDEFSCPSINQNILSSSDKVNEDVNYIKERETGQGELVEHFEKDHKQLQTVNEKIKETESELNISDSNTKKQTHILIELNMDEYATELNNADPISLSAEAKREEHGYQETELNNSDYIYKKQERENEEYDSELNKSDSMVSLAASSLPRLSSSCDSEIAEIFDSVSTNVYGKEVVCSSPKPSLSLVLPDMNAFPQQVSSSNRHMDKFSHKSAPINTDLDKYYQQINSHSITSQHLADGNTCFTQQYSPSSRDLEKYFPSNASQFTYMSKKVSKLVSHLPEADKYLNNNSHSLDTSMSTCDLSKSEHLMEENLLITSLSSMESISKIKSSTIATSKISQINSTVLSKSQDNLLYKSLQNYSQSPESPQNLSTTVSDLLSSNLTDVKPGGKVKLPRYKGMSRSSVNLSTDRSLGHIRRIHQKASIRGSSLTKSTGIYGSC
ncbi:unnamed protein product, partial [Meganyctiphanes norvegica]